MFSIVWSGIRTEQKRISKFKKAISFYLNEREMVEWFQKKNEYLGNRTPIELMASREENRIYNFLNLMEKHELSELKKTPSFREGKKRLTL